MAVARPKPPLVRTRRFRPTSIITTVQALTVFVIFPYRVRLAGIWPLAFGRLVGAAVTMAHASPSAAARQDVFLAANFVLCLRHLSATSAGLWQHRRARRDRRT